MWGNWYSLSGWHRETSVTKNHKMYVNVYRMMGVWVAGYH